MLEGIPCDLLFEFLYSSQIGKVLWIWFWYGGERC